MGGGQGEPKEGEEGSVCRAFVKTSEVYTPAVVSMCEGAQGSQNGEALWALSPQQRHVPGQKPAHVVFDGCALSP